MRPRPPSDHRRRRADRPLVLAVVAAFLAVAGGPVASGAEFSEGSTRSAEVSGHENCKCGKACRGASCCCSKHGSPAPSGSRSTTRRPAGPQAATVLSDAGPCIGSAPCGGDGLPGSGPGWTVVKSAALGSLEAFHPARSGSLLTAPSTLAFPSSLASRLDDPPEPSTLV